MYSGRMSSAASAAHHPLIPELGCEIRNLVEHLKAASAPPLTPLPVATTPGNTSVAVIHHCRRRGLCAALPYPAVVRVVNVTMVKQVAGGTDEITAARSPHGSCRTFLPERRLDARCPGVPGCLHLPRRSLRKSGRNSCRRSRALQLRSLCPRRCALRPGSHGRVVVLRPVGPRQTQSAAVPLQDETTHEHQLGIVFEPVVFVLRQFAQMISSNRLMALDIF